MSTITLHAVSKFYGTNGTRVTAVDHIGLDVAEAEFLALMGESGAGKSTLLSIMGGLLSPSQGSVRIGEVNIYELSLKRLADFRREFMGFIFQSFQLVPYLTVGENVGLPLAVTGHSEKEKKRLAAQALDRVGLTGKDRRLPDQLSGGEQERVAIARALVNNPPILYADEPTGNLDSVNSNRIMSLLKDLNAEGQTIVMVTHSRENAEYSHRVVEVRDGRVAAQ